MRFSQLTLCLVLIGLSTLATANEVNPMTETVGTATYTFKDRRFADVFSKTLVFGHSISSGLMAKVTSPFAADGPGSVLAKKYAKSSPVGNIAEGIGTMETGLTKMWRWVEQVDDTDGDSRRISYMNELFDKSTAIVGVDAFYMSVVFNECEDYGSANINWVIDKFVQKSYDAGKVLVLGSVPKEDYSKVKLVAKMVVKHENESCRQMINSALYYSCQPSRNCYINDIEGIVAELNTTGKLTLNDGTVLLASTGFPFYSNEARPDGINLSERGVQVLVEDILEKLAANPPHKVQMPPSLQMR